MSAGDPLSIATMNDIKPAINITLTEDGKATLYNPSAITLELGPNLFYSADDLASLQAEIDRLREELHSVLTDWNALVAAIGSPTHGGAVGHANRLREELAAAQSMLRQACRVMSLNLPQCDYCHHDKQDRHEFGHPCPVEERYEQTIESLRELLGKKEKRDE